MAYKKNALCVVAFEEYSMQHISIHRRKYYFPACNIFVAELLQRGLDVWRSWIGAREENQLVKRHVDRCEKYHH